MALPRVLAALAFAVAVAPACSTDPDSGAACHAGDRIACSCPGGNGTSSCVDGVFAACDCAGAPGTTTTAAGGAGGAGGANAGGADVGGGGAATGGGGASSGGGGSGGASGLPFGAPCTDDAECASMLCYSFGMGSKCTIPCPPDPADCPNGGKGCNNMAPAVCKP